MYKTLICTLIGLVKSITYNYDKGIGKLSLRLIQILTLSLIFFVYHISYAIWKNVENFCGKVPKFSLTKISELQKFGVNIC